MEGNIKTDLRQTVCENVDLIQIDQDRVQRWAFMGTVMNLLVP